MPRASDNDVTFQFHNPLYAQAFARSNNAKVITWPRTKPSRGANILSGNNAFASVLATVVVGAIAHSVIFSAMQDYSGSKETSASDSSTLPHSTRTVRSSPENSSVPTNSSPPNANSELAARIQLEKAHAKAMETDIEQMDTDLKSMSDQIGEYKTKIDGYENRLHLGLAIDESDYQQAIDEHNRIVDSYNAALQDRKQKYDEYSKEINSVNDMVAQYNNGQR